MAGKGKYYESQFEEATIALLHESHWQYTFGDDIHRKYTDPLIEDDLRAFLAAQYKDKQLTGAEVDGIVANLRNMGGQNDYFALQNTFLLYRDGFDFTYSDGRGNPFRLQYIDFEHPDHNIFRCVNQFVMEQGRENRRPDILLSSTAYRSASLNSRIRLNRAQPSATLIRRFAPDTCATFLPY